MNAYSMHLKILHRLIFSQIYTGVWDIDFVLLLIKSFFAYFFFFLDTHSVKTDDGFTRLAADYPFIIWVETDFLFGFSTLSNNKLKHLPKEVFSRNSDLLKL